MSKRARFFLYALLAAAAAAPWTTVPGAPKVGVIESLELRSVELSLLFDREVFRAKGLPGWCQTFVRFANERKRRPLYAYGWGKGGEIKIAFGNNEGTSETYQIKSSGEGKVWLTGYNYSGALDAPDFACSDWLGISPTPEVEVTLKSLGDWKIKNDDLVNLLNPNRKNAQRAPLAEVDATATMDIGFKVAGKASEVKKVPCKIKLLDMAGYWSMKYWADFVVTGANLGLTGDDAGEIKVHLSGEGCGQVPVAFKAPGSAPGGKKGGKGSDSTGGGAAPPSLDAESGL